MTYAKWTRNSVAYRVYENASSECAKAFAPAPKPVANEWIRPGKPADVRLYINNLVELSGLDVNRYKSGNISSAALDGEYISNAKATDLYHWLTGAKVWMDTTGKLNAKTWGNARAMTARDLLDKVGRACAVHGITAPQPVNA